MTEEELTKLEALSNAATPGPWKAINNEIRYPRGNGWEVRGSIDEAITGWGCVMQTRHNATFIAESHNALPALIALAAQIGASL